MSNIFYITGNPVWFSFSIKFWCREQGRYSVWNWFSAGQLVHRPVCLIDSGRHPGTTSGIAVGDGDVSKWLTPLNIMNHSGVRRPANTWNVEDYAYLRLPNYVNSMPVRKSIGQQDVTGIDRQQTGSALYNYLLKPLVISAGPE